MPIRLQQPSGDVYRCVAHGDYICLINLYNPDSKIYSFLLPKNNRNGIWNFEKHDFRVPTFSHVPLENINSQSVTFFY